MNAGLRDCTAVITGSTSGIGLGLAEGFAAAGCRLVINGVATPAEADMLAKRLRQEHGAKVLFIQPILPIPINANSAHPGRRGALWIR